MTEKKTYKCSKVKQTCKYCGRISSPKATFSNTCDYLLKTGKRRGCNPEACDKYEPRELPNKKEDLYFMWYLLALVLTIGGLLASNEMILIAAAGFAIAGEVDFLSEDLKRLGTKINKKDEG